MFGFVRPRPVLDSRDRIVIAPHHPDRLRRPRARPGAADADRLLHALTWNVFRTLELLTPAFWLRRLQVRLAGESSSAAPHIARVSLWQPLPLPPIQRIDGACADVSVDVVIETEHALWTIIVGGVESDWSEGDERAARVIDAGAWLAGARDHYCGVIEPETSELSIGGVLTRRYARSRDSVSLRSATRGPAAPALKGFGAVPWTDLAAILRDCADAENLPPIERALARNATMWLEDVGIRPAPPSGR
jgi:hypothetical protein